MWEANILPYWKTEIIPFWNAERLSQIMLAFLIFSINIILFDHNLIGLILFLLATSLLVLSFFISYKKFGNSKQWYYQFAEDSCYTQANNRQKLNQMTMEYPDWKELYSFTDDSWYYDTDTLLVIYYFIPFVSTVILSFILKLIFPSLLFTIFILPVFIFLTYYGVTDIVSTSIWPSVTNPRLVACYVGDSEFTSIDMTREDEVQKQYPLDTIIQFAIDDDFVVSDTVQYQNTPSNTFYGKEFVYLVLYYNHFSTGTVQTDKLFGVEKRHQDKIVPILPILKKNGFLLQDSVQEKPQTIEKQDHSYQINPVYIQAIRCPSCNNLSSKESKFCEECGTPLIEID